jgi:hypothetical protein
MAKVKFNNKCGQASKINTSVLIIAVFQNHLKRFLIAIGFYHLLSALLVILSKVLLFHQL